MIMVPVLVILCVLTRAIDAAFRVFGGKDTDPQEYPYVVRLEIKYMVNEQDAYFHHFSHVCTAAVLTPIWTLTAGHCINFREYNKHAATLGIKINYVIRYGSTGAYQHSTDSFSEIVASVRHPAFRLLKTNRGDAVANDVGLLKTMPIHLEQYGKLSGVEYPSLVGQAAVAVGYGLMNDGEKVASTLSFGKTLQTVNVVIKNCAKEISGGSFTPTLCLSRQCREPASICPGDSGGPLIHFSGVVGINQMGVTADCLLETAKAGLSSNEVGLITPISPYVGWISDQIKKGNEVEGTITS